MYFLLCQLQKYLINSFTDAYSLVTRSQFPARYHKSQSTLLIASARIFHMIASMYCGTPSRIADCCWSLAALLKFDAWKSTFVILGEFSSGWVSFSSFLTSRRIFCKWDIDQLCIFWQTNKFFLLQGSSAHLPNEEPWGIICTQALSTVLLGLPSAQLVNLTSVSWAHLNLLLLYFAPIQTASMS